MFLNTHFSLHPEASAERWGRRAWGVASARPLHLGRGLRGTRGKGRTRRLVGLWLVSDAGVGWRLVSL